MSLRQFRYTAPRSSGAGMAVTTIAKRCWASGSWVPSPAVYERRLDGGPAVLHGLTLGYRGNRSSLLAELSGSVTLVVRGALVPVPDSLVDTGKSLPTVDSSLRGNDGQVKRVSGIRHIQVETVLVPHADTDVSCASVQVCKYANVQMCRCILAQLNSTRQLTSRRPDGVSHRGASSFVPERVGCTFQRLKSVFRRP